LTLLPKGNDFDDFDDFDDFGGHQADKSANDLSCQQRPFSTAALKGNNVPKSVVDPCAERNRLSANGASRSPARSGTVLHA
jgi:hypothetical protein